MTQSFDPESFPTEGPFTTWGMCPSVGTNSESKSCITLPSPTAVFRIMDDEQLYHLMTWFSPSFPIGSFNYSHGIEYGVSCKLIRCAQTLQEWVSGIIQFGTGRVDACFFRAVYELLQGEDPDFTEILSLANALKPSPELWAESSRQGVVALKTLLVTMDSKYLQILKHFLTTLRKQPTLSIVFATICSEYQIPLQNALTAYLHAFAANLISSGIKLIPLGHTDGQKITIQIKTVVQKTVHTVINAPKNIIGGACPMVDWTSVQHESQYTKLFQS